jgi:hypothetical protein
VLDHGLNFSASNCPAGKDKNHPDKNIHWWVAAFFANRGFKSK